MAKGLPHIQRLFAAVLGIAMLHPTAVLAQTDTSVPQSASATPSLSQQDWSFWPDEQDQAPQTTHSGSSRNPDCNSHGAMPLTPHAQIGRTSQQRPDLLLYVSSAVPHQAIFAIQSVNNFYHAVPITLPEATGIVRIPLPPEIPDLADNEQYRWSLVFLCHDELGPDSPVLSRWLETQVSTHESELPMQPSIEQAAQYRDDALWYDMIAMLAQLKSGHPEDDTVQQAWLSVLSRQRLENLADEPIVP